MKNFIHSLTAILACVLLFANSSQAALQQISNISPTNLTEITMPPVIFVWLLNGNGAAPQTYELQISSDVTFTTTDIDIAGITTTIIEVDLTSLTVGTIYYWRVIGLRGSQTATSPYTAFVITQELPVELTSFVASVQDNNVSLRWTTVTEVNNYGFDLERKIGSSNWMKIGFVDGNGNSNSPKEYRYSDNNLKPGSYSYRLKQIDNDGSYEYSNIIELNIGIPISLELKQNYPNPFNPSTTISFTLSNSENVTLKIYNTLGEEVAELVNGFTEAGVYTLDFNAEDLPSGMYVYQLKSNENSITKKMLFLK